MRDEHKRITGYRLCITAVCEECGLPFHFPNYVENNEKNKIMNVAFTCDKSTTLVTPIVPGEFAPQLN